MSVFARIAELISLLNQQDIRIWLENNQLRFSAPKDGLSPATRDLLRQNKQEIIHFLQQAQEENTHALQKVDASGLHPLSFAQERIWFLCQLDPQNRAFFLTRWFEIRGQLDHEYLQQVLNRLVQEHGILRTAYIQTEQGTFQQRQACKTLPLICTKLDAHQRAEFEATGHIPASLSDAASGSLPARPFNLEQGDVVQCILYEVAENHVLLCCRIHHIATDAWSMNIIGAEIARLYHQAITKPESNTTTQSDFQYVDFAVWQKHRQDSARQQQQLHYWLEQLRDVPNLAFPVDAVRPAIANTRGKSIRFVLDRMTTQALNQLARDNDCTLYMVMLSIFGVLLHRYSQQADFCIGTPVSGRTHSQTENMIGCFLNMVAIRTGFPSDMSINTRFVDVLEKNRQTIQQAFAHQDVPFEQVVKHLATHRDLSVTPIFQVMFAWQNTPLQAINTIDGIGIRLLESQTHTAHYELNLSMREWQGEIQAEFDYQTALFHDNTIVNLVETLQRLIQAILANPTQSIYTCDLLGDDARNRQLQQWNQTAHNYANKPSLLHHLFEQQVTAHPARIAVRFQNQLLDYATFNQQANQLAHFLQQHGIVAGDIVGVYLERSLHLPVALMAILKCGAAYLPLDLGFPAERLDYIAHHAGLRLLLAQSHLDNWNNTGLTRINLDQLSLSDNYSNDNLHITVADAALEKTLFNVIYTSGSSGEPKGVMVSHAAIINRLLWMQECFPITDTDNILQKTPYSFDVSVWELFWPLMSGATLILANPQGHKNPAYMRDLIRQENISTVHFVPSMLGIFLQTEHIERCTSLRQVFCSGEVLPATLVQQFYQLFPNSKIINLYGPTEAAIDVSYHVCQPQDVTNSRGIPIGKPIFNTQLFVLDDHQQCLPVGATGEIVIGGDNLAEGYLHQPELTRAAFIDISLNSATKQKLYRTGDLGRFDSNGVLYFCGRRDQQVKIRGFRIELGEVEHKLLKHPDILQCAVRFMPGQTANVADARLVAYIVTRQSGRDKQTSSNTNLRNFLLQSLPSFMVPVSFVDMHSLPLTSNGKINLHALPDPDRNPQARNNQQNNYVAPRDAIEERLVQVWSEILGIDKVGVFDNFFELGGHSLMATIAITRLQKDFNITIPLRDIFQDPTIATIANAIRTAQQAGIQARTNIPPVLDDEEEITL